MKRKNDEKKIKYRKAAVFGVGVLLVAVCWQNLKHSGDAPAFSEILKYAGSNLYVKTLETYMPTVLAASGEETKEPLFRNYFLDKIMEFLPITGFASSGQEYDTQVESAMSYEMLASREGVDEQYRNGERVEDQETPQGETPAGGNSNGSADTGQETAALPEKGVLAPSMAEPVVQISREKLNDFDYLIQNFYTVDRTTTIDGSLLNAQELLAKNMRLTTTADQPQILIHHTHSQEEYADSNGDASTSIVGVGEYLTKLLREQYGFNVIHDTGEYDLIDHDNAYSYAGPAVEQILAEHPSIEMIIDLHRDGIGEGKLVTEVNGKATAKIMFFNGLSRTTKNGDLSRLYNPYLADNLALSLQMKVAAEEYYPGFTRTNYLKAYRYNLHYVPRSMLIEVGAQTNTVEEAMNAMEPLADLLHKVLGP